MDAFIRKWLLMMILGFASLSVGATDLKWLASEYDFGAIKEADGLMSGSVRFVNTGKESTFIRTVRVSCGCTAADFTKEIINPGDTATINFTYDPAGRPGPFDKTVKVYIGEDNDLKTIRIFGTVIGSSATLDRQFPIEAGPLRFETLLEGMGEVKRTSSRHVFINVYNQGEDTISPVCRSKDAALGVKLTPGKIAPGEIGTLGFYLNASKVKEAGPVEFYVSILPDVDSPDSEEREVEITASIVPDTSMMTAEEIRQAPAAYLVPEFIDLGEDVGNVEIGFSFEVLNEGGSALKVERVYSRDSAIKIDKTPKKIKPGKTSPVSGTLDATMLDEGAFRIPVEVITSDPLHPVRTAYIVGIK